MSGIDVQRRNGYYEKENTDGYTCHYYSYSFRSTGETSHINQLSGWTDKENNRRSFQLNYVQNRGAAWGSFSGKIVFLLAITFVILLAAIYVYIRLAGNQEKKYTPLRISLVFLISGAVGNMIDRVARGYVVDMFDFCLINFPVFNVADIFVTCSFIVIVILVLFKYKDDELSEIIHPKQTDGQE